MSKRQYGLSIEREAQQWYEKRGARLIHQNYYCRGGEVDLIFEEASPQGRELVFVEVRARDKRGWVSGIESLTLTKKRRLRRAISLFLSRYDGQAQSIRIDLLSWDGLEWTHYPNLAF